MQIHFTSICLLSLSVGCGGGKADTAASSAGGYGGGGGSENIWDFTGTPPDFSLEDVNPTSPTYGQVVSPRDLLETVTGWYFAHAT